MEVLREAYERLGEVEGEIRRDLANLEVKTLEQLKITGENLKKSPIKNIELKLGENFNKIESFGKKLKTVADESDSALNRLKIAVNVVETVTIMYNAASKIIEHFGNETLEESKEEIEKYIKEVDKTKKQGYWEEVNKVISKGYIGQIIGTLKSVTLESLKNKISTQNTKILTRLAVALNAETEAYESYLSSVKMESEKKVVSNTLTSAGGEIECLTKVIQNAKNLHIRQANTVFTELGAYYYVEISREIHKYASSEASKIFREFVKLNFGQFIEVLETNRSLQGYETDERTFNRNNEKKDNGNGVNNDEDVTIEKLEKVINNANIVESIVSEGKHQKLLDTIAIMASMWNEFESALRNSTKPVYENLLVKADQNEYSADGLVFLSEATKNLQCILSAYVHLQHAFTLKTVVQAIQVSDTIYISQDENTLTSTLVDDVFFILQKSQQRSIATGDIQTACATFNQISGIFSNELKTALMENLVQSQPIYERWAQKLENLNGSLYNMLDEYFKRTRGNMPEVIGSKFSFVHSLNNLEECMGLLAKFKEEMTECFSQEFLKDNQEKNLLVDNTIQALDLVKTELQQIMDTCCNYTTNMFKEHLNEPLNKFTQLDFDMDEEKYTRSQNDSSFGDLIVAILHVILKHIESCYSHKVGIQCMSSLVEKICKFLESTTLTKRFTIYGAVYFDGAIRTLVHSCSTYGQEVRKQFTTLLQISDVLNVNNNDDILLLKESEYTIDISRYSALRTDLNF